jgi:electron transfer flavoprotein alpha subunit
MFSKKKNQVPQLEDSKIVISAGRGMVEKDNLSLGRGFSQ